MPIAALPAILAIGSGGIIGLVLGLVGGGGSILAVPLLVYLVGVSSPHVAIGTAAIAVALNAAVSLGAHARHGRVKWRCAGVFAAAGMAGSLLGAELGKAVDGQRLLALFGLMMIAVGLSMLRPATGSANDFVRLTQEFGRLSPASADRRGFQRRNPGRVLRHWRRVSDRSGLDAGDWYGAAERDRHLAGRRGSLRPDHGGKLCYLGLRRLGTGVAGDCWRSGRKHRRRAPNLGPVNTKAYAEPAIQCPAC